MTSFMDSRLRGFLDDYIGWMFLFLSCRHKNDYIVHTKYLRKKLLFKFRFLNWNPIFVWKVHFFLPFGSFVERRPKFNFLSRDKTYNEICYKDMGPKIQSNFYRMICSKKNPLAQMNGIDEIDCLYVQESHLGTLCIVPK